MLPRVLPLMAALVAGCGTAPPLPALSPGDTVRPHLSFLPEEPWAAGTKGYVLLRLYVHRPGRAEPVFLTEGDVPVADPHMQARVTFLVGDAPLGEPFVLPFAAEC